MGPQMGPPETTIWEYPFPDTSWEIEIGEFIDAIGKGRKPVGNIEDAYAALKIIDDIYGRAAT